MVEKFMVEEFMVENSWVKSPGLKLKVEKIRGLTILQPLLTFEIGKKVKARINHFSISYFSADIYYIIWACLLPRKTWRRKKT